MPEIRLYSPIVTAALEGTVSDTPEEAEWILPEFFEDGIRRAPRERKAETKTDIVENIAAKLSDRKSRTTPKLTDES